MDGAEPKFVPRANQVDYTNIRWAPVVNCVLVHKDTLLLVQRNKAMRLYPEFWNGISGFLDDDKSLDEKVREELFEETGLGDEHILNITLCGVFDQDAPDVGKTWIVHAVRVEIDTTELTFDWEAQDYCWVTKDEALRYTLLPGFREVLDATV